MEHTETAVSHASDSARRRRPTRSATDETAGRDGAPVGDLDLLVVGTFAGGGIHRYIEEQVDRLGGVLSVETHDMASPPTCTGPLAFARGMLLGLLAMLRFPLRDRPDVAHVHTSHTYSFYRSSVYVLFAHYVWGVPVVLHVHGSSFDEFVATDSQLVAALQRYVFGLSDEIIVLSEYWRDVLSMRADPERVRVVPNAVDPSTFPVERASDGPPDATADGEAIPDRTNGDGTRPAPSDSSVTGIVRTDGDASAIGDGDASALGGPIADAGGGRDGREEGAASRTDRSGADSAGETPVPHVVFVSNLIERKGVRELADALDRLLDARPGELRVTIAGDGSLSDRVERLEREREAVTYLGYVSEERKRSLLAEGSIYVLPTYAEGLPIAMLEGMAGRNAVVSTTVGSIPEVIDEDRGILVEPGDVDALTEALETLVTSPERREEMAANNRQAVAEEYSWCRVRAELLDVYGTHARAETRS